MSIRPFRDIKRRKTREINVGKVKVGGNNPISVQSMTNTLTTDTKATIKQINEFAKISPGLNACYGSTKFRFYVESPLHSPTALDYDFELDTYCGGRPGESTKDYFMEKAFATSLDGTIIPMTLVGLASSDSDSPRPTVLVAYGSYGEMNVPSYDPTLVPLLRRNFVIAYAHTRGGGELGTKWYEKGRGGNKPRAIEDLIACAEALTNQLAVTEPHLLGVRAFSAGAVIAASAVNERPTLFSTLCLANPFVDVFGAMSDPTLPLTEHERDEWGDYILTKGKNPNQKFSNEVFDFLDELCFMGNDVGLRKDFIISNAINVSNLDI